MNIIDKIVKAVHDEEDKFYSNNRNGKDYSRYILVDMASYLDLKSEMRNPEAYGFAIDAHPKSKHLITFRGIPIIECVTGFEFIKSVREAGGKNE